MTIHRDRGAWMQTASGRKFYLFDPRPEEIHLEDLQHHLGHLCRFTGATRHFYSVAQHATEMALRLENEGHPLPILQWALLHDAAEAYLNDLARPVKQAVGLGTYRGAERRILEAVAQRFGLPAELPAEVRLADARMLFTERRDLLAPMQEPDEGWGMDLGEDIQPYEEPVKPWGPLLAQTMFLSVATRLGIRPVAPISSRR